MTSHSVHRAPTAQIDIVRLKGSQGHPRVTQVHGGCRVRQGGVLAHAHLWVLEESVLVVDAASTAVLLWVLMSCPGTVKPGLLPCLVDAQVGCVNQAALNDVGKVPAHVLKGHPKCRKAMSSVHRTML